MKTIGSLRIERTRQHGRAFRIALISSLLLHICFINLCPDIEAYPPFLEAKEMSIDVVDIPLRQKIRLPAPPPTPYIATPTNGEVLPGLANVEPIEIYIAEYSGSPPPAYDRAAYEFTFIPHEIPPEPIGGLAAIHRAIQYPWRALRKNLESRVIIGLLVDETGKVIKTSVLQPSGSNVGFEEAAVQAVLKSKWKPARQREKPVKVWLAIPVRFTMR